MIKMKKINLSQNKRDVRIIGGIAKIVEIENGKIIKIIRDYKRPIYQNKPDTFVDIANRFYDNIKEFVDIRGEEYYNYGYNIYEEFDKDYPKSRQLSPNERVDLLNNYKKNRLEKLPSKKLRKIICNYIIERFHLMCEIYKIKIPYFKNERDDMESWFKKNCGYFFDLGIISRHNHGIDYLCEYGFDPLMLSFISKDKKVSDFFNKFIDQDDLHKECGTKHLQIELEYQSGNFILHKHPIEHTDMVICFKKDKHIDVPILELCQWSEKPIERDIDEYLEDLDHHLEICYNLSFESRLKYSDREDMIGHIYELLKYIENHRSMDNEEQEIKKFLLSDHRLRIILDACSTIDIIKKEYIEDIINNGKIDIEFFVDKDILSVLISDNKVIYGY
jgi:hypothetical protein